MSDDHEIDPCVIDGKTVCDYCGHEIGWELYPNPVDEHDGQWAHVLVTR